MFQKVERADPRHRREHVELLLPELRARLADLRAGGARTEAKHRGMPYLGEMPLDMQIRQTSDDGRPIVAIDPDGVHAKHYIGMAREIWTAIVTGAAHRPPPRIVIE